MPKVVLITGCSSGLGRALARRLAAEADGEDCPCYTVYATARSVKTLAGLEGEGIKALQLDVTSQKSVDAAVKAVLREAGRIDVLVNNAGLSRVGPLAEQPLAEVEEVLQTNLLGPLRLTQAVAPSMMRQRSGLVLQIGSVTAMLSTPFAGAYGASKAALLAATDSLRLELAPFGVRVAYAACGQIRSDFSANILAAGSTLRYEQPGALYAAFAPAIRARASISQGPGVMPAEQVADQIATAITAAALGRPAWGGAWLARCGRLVEGCRAAAAHLLARFCPALAARVASEQAQQTAAEEEEAAAEAARREEAGIRRRAPCPPPTWFLAGGGAVKFWLLGVLQKLAPFGGWPSNHIIARQFGVHRALPTP